MAFLEANFLALRFELHVPQRFGRWLRRAHRIDPYSFPALEAAFEDGRLTKDDLDALAAADLVVAGSAWDDGEQLCFAVEISSTIHSGDVTRALERTAILARAGLRAKPFVAGFAVSEPAQRRLDAIDAVVCIVQKRRYVPDEEPAE